MHSSWTLNEPSENVIGSDGETWAYRSVEELTNDLGFSSESLADPELSDGVQLAEQIRALQLAQVVIKQSLDRRIANARQHQNALRPVNKLPAEVLSAILHQFIANASIFDHFTSLFIVAGVSAHWKSVVDSTPSLWSFVSSNHTKLQLDRALKKSGRTPISVACRYTGDVLTATSKQGSRDFLRSIQSTDRQWDELALHLPTIGHLQAFLKVQLPHLRKLDINVAYPSSAPLDLFGGKRGALEDVRLTNAYLEWDSEALSRLQRLQLDYREASYSGPSLTQILWLLQQNPRLRSFSWSGSIPHNTPITRAIPTITLSHLTKLSLREVSEFGVFKILESIDAPSCSQFTIQCDSGDGDTELLSHLQRFLPNLKNSLQQAATISVCLGPSSFHYHCVPKTPDCPSKLDFKFERAESFSLFEWFAEQLHDFSVITPPINIRFDPRFDFTCDDTILPTLFRLRNVVSVTVADRVVGPCRLLKWLSRPITSQGNTPSWPFPNLREMELGQSNLLIRDVLSFFRSRYPVSSPIILSGRLVRLQTLRLVGRGWQDNSAEQDLKRILLGTEYSLKRSSWVHVPCKVNDDSVDVGDEESSCDSYESYESSMVDSETASETDYSDASESEDSEDEIGDE
ncbi:hypothetical protein M407DRAFT_21112 [Tulasnella calospora MUT 4182]|uniref:Uncharacterized protein n=1 Tax=Tulasnella calospora MUT 4182 TaxID=1051891 RepID=A0A0C3QF11_9AGAM|nr:hypothetical protein M407DRAFT_21112 [Tulasnella calospora MUT 4182]